MLVFYTGSFRFPAQDAAAPRVLNNAKILSALGHEVKFISFGGIPRPEERMGDSYVHDGFKYVNTGDLPIGKQTLLNRIKGFFYRGNNAYKVIKGKPIPDLIITYNTGFIFNIKLIRYCKVNHIKLISDITEWYDSNEFPGGRFFLPYWMSDYNMRIIQKQIPNKICITKYLSDYYKDSNNIVIPPLCDLSDNKWSFKKTDCIIDGFTGITLIYAGNPAKKDCLHTVINAINTLSDEGKSIRFVILGVTKKSYLKQYKNKIYKSHLCDNVVFLGRVSQDSIPAYYKKADFMILLREPTRKNMAGFPTKFAESMIAGIPVITNSTSDLSNYVVNGKNGFLIDYYDYQHILSFLKEIVLNLNKDIVLEMKEQTRKMNSVFDYRHYIKEMDLFIHKLR